MSETRTDAFLGGRLRIVQPVRGYRAGIDAVLLAAAIPARPGDAVLDLGCGVGTAALCLAERVDGLDIVGIERQASYAELARRNVADNCKTIEVVTADIADLPASLRQRQFDHVIANPPYFRSGQGTAASDSGREAALREDLPLGDWIAIGARRLKPGGRMTLILAAERLPDALAEMRLRLGSLSLQPLAPRRGRPARLAIAWGLKGGRGPFVLRDPIVLHQGDRHLHDSEDYTPGIRAVLRDAAMLLPVERK